MGSKSSKDKTLNWGEQSFISANSENSERENITKLKTLIRNSRCCQCFQSDRMYQTELGKSEWYLQLLDSAKQPEYAQYTWANGIAALISAKIEFSYHTLHQQKLAMVAQKAIQESRQRYSSYKAGLSQRNSPRLNLESEETKIIDQMYEKSELIQQQVAQQMQGDEFHRISMINPHSAISQQNLNVSLIDNAVVLEEQKLQDKNCAEYQAIYYYKSILSMIEPLFRKKNICFFYMLDYFVVYLRQKFVNLQVAGFDDIQNELRDFVYYFLEALYQYFNLEQFNSQKVLG